MSTDLAALTQTVFEVLHSIAPEVDTGELLPTRALRSQIDLDSMDWLNFLIGLHQRLGVDIPEADYAALVSLDNVLDYLQAKIKP
jgi:acyl carrier protein